MANVTTAAYTARLTGAQIFGFADLVRRLNQAYGPDTGSFLREDITGALWEIVRLTPEPSEVDSGAYCRAMNAGQVPNWGMDDLALTETTAQWTARACARRAAGPAVWPGLAPRGAAVYEVPLTAAQILGFEALACRLGIRRDGEEARLRHDLWAELQAFAGLLPEPSAADTAGYMAAVRDGELPDWAADDRPLTETAGERAERICARRAAREEDAHGEARAADRGWDEVLADAIRSLTEAARLRRPVLQQSADGGWEPHPVQTEPADWAEFVTLAVAGAAANIGSTEKALQGRPGSWEADAVRSMLLSTVGEDPAELLRHRTEPVRVVLRPAEILSDLRYASLYDESRQNLRAEQDRHVWRYRLGEDRTWSPLDPGAPDWADALDVPASQVEIDQALCPGTVVTVPRSADDEAAYDVLADQEAALEDMQYEDDPRAYGEALTTAVLAEAGRRYPGITVETTVDIDERTWPEDSLYWAPEDQLVAAAVDRTPLPWSGIAPADYPPGQSVADTERAAGRLPHLRLARGEAGR
jgi:hypothetical protein